MNKIDKCNCIEISSLREINLDKVLNEINDLDLSKYEYISFHVPSKLEKLSEDDIIEKLKYIYDKNWNIIAHPDIIKDFNKWNIFGEKILIENMDTRKPIGKDCDSLNHIFNNLPQSNLCFDIAHSLDVDILGFEGEFIVNTFCEKIKQIHISGITESKHQKINEYELRDFEYIFTNARAFLIKNTPFIIESPVCENEIDTEIQKVEDLIFNISNNLNRHEIKNVMKLIENG